MRRGDGIAQDDAPSLRLQDLREHFAAPVRRKSPLNLRSSRGKGHAGSDTYWAKHVLAHGGTDQYLERGFDLVNPIYRQVADRASLRQVARAVADGLHQESRRSTGQAGTPRQSPEHSIGVRGVSGCARQDGELLHGTHLV